MAQIPIQYTRHFDPLIDGTPYDFANIYGGRASMKTETTARLALGLGIERDMRICFARETMSSMKESSHETLTSIIYSHEMAVSQNGPYRVMEDRIVRKDGEETKTEFIFVGIRERVRDSKGLHGIDLTVVEEAAKVSKDSWTVFIPTVMRKSGSKMWVVWNPEAVSDDTYQRFILRPPSNCIQIHTTYIDNPWASAITKQLAADCKARSEKEYQHIWLGAPIDELDGAIYQAEMRAALDEGRITDVPYIKGRPVYTAWDLGMGDPTVVWFVQQDGPFLNFIDYLEVQDTYFADVMIMVQQRGYLYAMHYLPHDGIDAILHKKYASGGHVQDIDASPLTVMQAAGMPCQITDKFLKGTTVDKLRGVLPRCRFDKTKCAVGIDHLRFYTWDGEAGDKRKPLHDQHCHAPEAAQVAAIKIKGLEVPEIKVPALPQRERTVNSWMG